MKRGDIVIYEPMGSGGIAHYSYMLANAIGRAGRAVRLLTTDPYELEELPRAFTLDRSLGGSIVKSWFARPKSGPGRHDDAIADADETKPEETNPNPARDESSGKNDTDTTATTDSPEPALSLRARTIWTETVTRVLFRRPAVFHVQWLANPAEELRYLKRIARAGVRVVYTAHNLLPHEESAKRSPWSGPVFEAHRRVYESVAATIVHSPANRDELEEKFGIASGDIAVIPHGHYGLFRDLAPATRAEARRALAIEHDDPIVLHFGAIRSYKGVNDLIDAMPGVLAKVPDARLHVVGTIPSDETVQRGDYEARIASRGVAKRTVLDDRYVPMEEVGLRIAAADVIALPYTKTYQSGILMLALAYGKPVVVTNTGGLPDGVREGENGFVVPTRNPAALARAIADVLADPERMRAMGTASRALSDAKFGWDAIAKKTLAVYDPD